MMTPRWVRLTLKALILVLLLAVAAALLYAWQATPRHSGSVQGGVSAPVQVARDARGIPSFRAASLADLGYAMGHAHAQDRGWQLEQQRRVVQGRLAELFGPPLLDTDRFLRVLGVHQAARAQWAWLQAQPDKAETVALLKAYAAGVNAGWRAQARPPEMLLLGQHWETWTPEDSLGWALMMAWDLSTNWNAELLRLRLALQLPGPVGARKALIEQQLMPPYPGDAPPPLADYPALYAELGLGATTAQGPLAALHAAAPLSGIEGTGSNNWAVSGARSATGQPLLANDPHLGLRSPALWYLARLEAPGLKIAGASLPGMPGLVLGQNERLAWAFTNTAPDTQDLYLEELRDAAGGGTEIRTPEGWRRAETRTETFKVKGAPDHTLQVRRGRHGPLISDAGPGRELLGSTGRRFALALRWKALEAQSDIVGSFLAMARAPTYAQFREALRSYHSPMQTMLVAEAGHPGDGGIHLIAPGRVPVRGAAHDLRGQVPAPGWDARYDWQGEIPFEDLPQRSNPPEGWLASANQKIVGPDYQPHLTYDWAAPWRQQRIEALLAAQPKHDLASFAALQGDQLSLAAAPLLPAFRAAQSTHPLAAALKDAQQGFQGQMDANAAAPALFWAWTRHLTEALLTHAMGKELAERALQTRTFRDALERILAQPDHPWCQGSCARQANAALDRALAELQTLLGPDPSRWRWGDLHVVRAEHTPFSRVKPLAPLFELSGPKDGDTYTLDAARVRLRPDAAGRRYGNDHGASLRLLFDLGDPARSQVMISSGQSGLPWRGQYRDLFGLWLKHEYVPLWASEPPVSTLTLQP